MRGRGQDYKRTLGPRTDQYEASQFTSSYNNRGYRGRGGGDFRAGGNFGSRDFSRNNFGRGSYGTRDWGRQRQPPSWGDRGGKDGWENNAVWGTRSDSSSSAWGGSGSWNDQVGGGGAYRSDSRPRGADMGDSWNRSNSHSSAWHDHPPQDRGQAGPPRGGGQLGAGATTRTNSEDLLPRDPYEARISLGVLTTPCRDYSELRHRYANLYISNDFTHVNILWLKQVIHLQKLLRTPITFTHGMDLCIPVPTARGAKVHQGVKHNARILILTVDKQADGLDKDGNITSTGGHRHLPLQLKFLVARKTNGIQGIGGPWRPEDGADPMDTDVLWNTAKRTAKETCNLDLTRYKGTPFAEIWYSREDESTDTKAFPAIKERTMLYLVFQKDADSDESAQMDDPIPVSTQVQDVNAVKQSRQSQLSEQEEKDLQNQIVLQPRTISLEGLLDYDLLDYQEKTFELSLFAELFYEMLETECGRAIFERLYDVRKEEEEEQTDEPPTKKQRADISTQWIRPDIPLLNPQMVPSDCLPTLQDAFEFFDRRRCGYLRAGDVESIAYSLGAHLPRRAVHNLVKHFVRNIDQIDYTQL
eukprot:TRINITY_DN62081_c0_g1_i2.p1 TRINITY_DN62081_c0_g1~~TRINITY_DN62081_c0_g1_i2.p1  ORF type:complete len:586 (-),score=36.14 TRINITY_DN62081_c0_g1_i2:501-2258(-)